MRGAKMIRAPAIPRCSASRRRFCPAAELMLEILLSEDQIRVAAARARAGWQGETSAVSTMSR